MSEDIGLGKRRTNRQQIDREREVLTPKMERKSAIKHNSLMQEDDI